MTQYKTFLTAKKSVVTQLINLTQKSVEDIAICLIGLENSIDRIKEKRQVVQYYWTQITIKVEEGTDVKDLEYMATNLC